MAESYLPSRSPFHITEDGFRVFETDRNDRFVCCSPGAVTYRGDLEGCARFIKRVRLELKGP